MKSIEITKEGYEGIPADKAALTSDDVKLWAGTKDAELIPQAIAVIKGFFAAATVETVTPSESTVSLAAAATKEVSVELSPEYVVGKTVTWTSSDSTKATVTADSTDSRKATITGVATGSATITATVDSHSGTITVTVA